MDTDPSSRKQQINIGYLIFAVLALLFFQWMWASYSQVETIPFSQFEELVAKGEVAEVAIEKDTIQGSVKNKLPSGKTQFVTARVDPALAEKLEAKGVVVTGVPSGGLIPTLLSWIGPAVVFYLFWAYFLMEDLVYPLHR